MTALKYAVLTGGLLAWLTFLGYPIRRLLDHADGRLSAVPSPFLGLAVVQLAGWYWLELGQNGLRAPSIVVTVLATAGIAVTVIRDRRRLRAIDPRRVGLSAGVLLAAAVVIGINFSAILTLPLLTTADAGNNDAVAYAVVAGHMVDSNFDDEGPVTDFDIGNQARTDGFGSSVVIGSFAALTGIEAFKTNTVVLFAFITLCVYGLALLVVELAPGREALAVGISFAAGCSLLFVFVAVTFFLGQLMATAVLPLLAVVGLRAAEWPARRDMAKLVAAAGALFLMLLSHYQQMVFLAPPVLLPAVVLASAAARPRLRDLARRLGGVAVVFGAGAAAASIVAPIWLKFGVDLTISRSNVVAGFALPGFVPVELIGFLRGLEPKPSAARIAWSAVVVVVFLAAAWAIRATATHAVRFCVVVAATILVSYALVYIREGGPSYRQWKWITYFQPVLLAAVLLTVLLALGTLFERRWARASAVALPSLAVLYALAVTTNTGDHPATALRDRRQFAYLTPEQIDLGSNDGLRDIDSINVDLAPYWDTMWTAYFLPDHELRFLNPTYYPVTAAEAGWTLVPASPGLSGPSVRPLNAAYSLLRNVAGPSSDDASALGASTEVELDPLPAGSTTLTGQARVTNTGDASWLPSTTTPPGAVNLSVQLTDATGAVTNRDWLRIPLIAGDAPPIPPGTTVTIPLAIDLSAVPDAPALTFQPVAEGVAFFGDSVFEAIPRS